MRRVFCHSGNPSGRNLTVDWSIRGKTVADALDLHDEMRPCPRQPTAGGRPLDSGLIGMTTADGDQGDTFTGHGSSSSTGSVARPTGTKSPSASTRGWRGSR